MEGKGATTYTLRNKGKDRNISGSTVVRLQNNESVSTNTLDTLCKILDCKLSDIAEFIPDKDTMLQGAEKALSNRNRQAKGDTFHGIRVLGSTPFGA